MKSPHLPSAHRFPAAMLALVTLSVRVAAQTASANYSITGEGFVSTAGVTTSINYTQVTSFGLPVGGDSSTEDFQDQPGGPFVPVRPDANLIVNGSFEDLLGTFFPDGNGVMSLPPGSTTIPGWTTGIAGLVWAPNTSVFSPRTHYGDFFLDLTGYHDLAPYAAISQAPSTTPGHAYHLSFALGAQQDEARFQGPVGVRVTLENRTHDFIFPPVGVGNQWQTFTLDFTAVDAHTVVSFEGVLATGGRYLGLDNVVLVEETTPPKIALAELRGSELHLHFTSIAGATHLIETRTDLASGGWGAIPGAIATGTGGTIRVIVNQGASASRGFYRVAVRR
ncbi:MAG: DUF642 domain-containing protein [Verrucomicrobiales bacterium]|nr:DUF642 domain-containing protein [Verrucomicrobiales bacterium]MCP5526238.1 DUF642 domain-containing protein [Verrucomicrobiales bacterium]